MLYPKDENMRTKNNSIIKPRYYYCETKSGQKWYPGLLKNSLSNSDEVPYLPCCYKTNHRFKKGCYYRQYFFDEEVMTQSKNIATASYRNEKSSLSLMLLVVYQKTVKLKSY